MSLPGCHAWMSASSHSVVGTTFACASAITRAMLRRTPLSCSGWPVAVDARRRRAHRLARCRQRASVRLARSRAQAGAPARGRGLSPHARAAAGAAPTFARSRGRRILHILHRDDASGAARRNARKIDAELLRQRAHGRHRFHAADRDRLFADARDRSTASRRRRCLRRPRPALSFVDDLAAFVGGDDPFVRRLVRRLARPRPFAGCRRRMMMAGRFGFRALRQLRIDFEHRRARRRSSITSPASPCNFATLPENGDGTSTTAFAVSIETSGSSSLTVSPSLTSHSTIVASGRPSPRSGR